MLIGVVARKGHGKDTVGDHLVANHGFQKKAFADKVKSVARALFPHLTEAQCYGPIEVKEALDAITGVTPRWIFQQVGTEIGRQSNFFVFEGLGISSEMVLDVLHLYDVKPGPTAWIDALLRTEGYGTLKTVEAALHPSLSYVVTDVRFPNEAEAIQKKRGSIIKVVRPSFDTGAFNDHASETEVDDCPSDYEIINSGTLQDLYVQVDEVIRWNKENP